MGELTVKELVEAGETAAFAFEDEVLFVEGGAVHKLVGLGLGGDLFQPIALGRGPGPRGEHGLQGTVHPLGEGDERIAKGGLPDVADDAGRHVLIGGLLPCGGEVSLGEAGIVECE